jgi:hypothetical protein
MWYRTAQISPTLPVLGLVNLLQLIDQLKPEKQVEYKKRLESLQQQNSSQDRTENLNGLVNDLNNEMSIQNNELSNQSNDIFEYVKPIVKSRIIGTSDQYGDFVDADKLFKQYLDAQGNLNVFSNINTSSDVFEIAKFFIENATDPRFDVVKKIIKKFPTQFFKFTDVVDLLLNFYLEYKLREIKAVIQKRQPLSPEDKLAIDFINSKIILHSMKSGVNLFNIVNKDIFGALLGSIASSTLEGVEGLQNQMNVNKSIQELINKSPK